MGENINAIMETLIAAVIMIIFPLYSAYTSKDDISYALAMSYTKDFVDTIAENGYITQDMYYGFLNNLKNGTDNSYEVLFTHKSLRYDILNDDDDEDEEDQDKILPPTVNITSAWETYDDNYVKNILFNSEDKMYLLSENDQINVAIRNTNTTLATTIFNIITANISNSTTRIYVDMTSNVRNEVWRQFEDIPTIYNNILQNGVEMENKI